MRENNLHKPINYLRICALYKLRFTSMTNKTNRIEIISDNEVPH